MLSNLPPAGAYKPVVYKKNKCDGFLINAALLNVYFILDYHSIYVLIKKIYFFKCLYFSKYDIRMYLYAFWLERGHHLSAYATGGEIGGGGGVSKAAYRGRKCHATCVHTHLNYLFSCFWQHFCLIVSCFICRNLTLYLIKKDVFIRNGYFSPTRSISAAMK